MSQATLSFEFFPPKDLPASFKLWETAQALMPYRPRHVSVTYGAGGSTRTLTHETVEALTAQGANVAAHLTCVGASREETLSVAKRYREAGVKEVVALRGDGARAEDGFSSSLELVEALCAEGLGVHVGAYPEPHPESKGAMADIEWLRAKFQAGASMAMTQFFFEADTFLRFRDACAAAGITQPITPGILPITDWNRTKSFAARCGAAVPTSLDNAFAAARTEDRCDLLALCVATELCDTLLSEGVERLHFYTLNRAELTEDVLQALGLRPAPALRKVA
ncbi:MAG: methylenetetrahydrofolate reductase [Pseudomonadota bacterium]